MPFWLFSYGFRILPFKNLRHIEIPNVFKGFALFLRIPNVRKYAYEVTPPVDKDIFSFGCRVAKEAAQLTLNWFQRPNLATDIKPDGTEVTDADRSAEEFLRSEIEKEFPNDTIIGEEIEDSFGDSSRRWIIDPIDGTASFVRGVPLYSSLLAMFDEHGPAIGLSLIHI